MTNSTTPTKRRSPGASLTWKSGILAFSLTAVIAGSALIARLDPPTQVAQAVQAQPTAAVVQPNTQSGQTQRSRTTRLSPLPTKPVFLQPITRTRRS